LNNLYKHYRINYQIQALKLRLLDDTGKRIGIIDKQEALRMAQSQEKDLVEIAPRANPPVVKLIDFKKFKYLEAKKNKESRKSSKNVGMKEIRLSPFIGEHDLNTKVAQATEFLKEGNQVKIAIPFRGREITRKEFGYNTMNKAIEKLAAISKVSRQPMFEGRVLVAGLAPFKETR